MEDANAAAAAHPTEIVYSKTRHPYAKGRRYQNPRHFAGPVEGATKVYLDGSHPDIKRAYERAGVPVIALGDRAPDTADAEAQGVKVTKGDLIAELRSLNIEPKARATEDELREMLAAAKAEPQA